MKLISWNVNGIRALHKKGAWQSVLALEPDVLFLQEIKALPEEMPDGVRAPEGYFPFFSNPKEKKGYSGTAIFTKQKPDLIKTDFHIPALDGEGRIIEIDFGSLALFNIYFPNGGMGPERLAYKLAFYDAFLAYILQLRREGKSVIFGGDLNTAHEEIDLARPKENEGNTGFLPEERAWIDEVIASGFVDTFRYLNPERREYSYWDMKTFARSRNVGWRLDYFFISNDLLSKLRVAKIHTDILGSDHCPTSVEIV